MEKTVSVRLKLLFDQFVKGSKTSGEAAKGIGDKAEEGAKKANRNWEQLGRQTSDMGSRLSSSVTVPVLAAGTAMAVMATKFGNTFTTMEATAGVASDEVAGLKDQVLDLSRETGRGPQELSEALLAVRSSGLAGAAAMDVLEMAAKGAASGMGDTREIANTLTSVIAAYGVENISAARAMDVLVAAVQQGKAEAAEMAPQFGRLLPIAAELGVEFHDVAGALAFLTRASGDASQSATQTAGVLAKLLKPSQAGAEALKEIGESAFTTKDMLAERGLLGTLTHLREEMTQSQFQALFDDVEAMNGALALTGPAAGEAEKVIDAVADSAGNADAAFGKWAESMGAKQAKAWASLQAGMIELGDLIVPTASEIISWLGKVVDVIADLPEPVQRFGLALAGAAAAAGPLLKIGGNLTAVFGGSSKLFDKIGTSALGMSAGLGASVAGFAMVAPLVITAGYALKQYIDRKEEAKRRTDEFAEALAAEAAGLEGEVDAFALAELTTGRLGTELRKSEADLELFADAIRGSGDELERLAGLSVFDTEDEVRKLADSGSALGQELERLMDLDSDKFSVGVDTLIEKLDLLSDDFDSGAIASEDMEYAIEQLGGESEATAKKTELLTQALQETIDAARASVDPFFAFADAMIGVRDAKQGWADADAELIAKQKELDELRASGTATAEEIAEGERGVADAVTAVSDAQLNASKSSVDLTAAAEVLRRKMSEQGLSASAARDSIYKWALNAGYSEDQARVMADEVFRLNEALASVEGITETTHIIRTVYETTQRGTRGGPGFRLHEGGMVPGPRGHEIAGVLLGGEEVLHWDDPRHSTNLTDKYMSANFVSQGALSGGGSVTIVNQSISLKGAIIASSADAQRWVAEAFNRAASRNLMTVRGRPL